MRQPEIGVVRSRGRHLDVQACDAHAEARQQVERERCDAYTDERARKPTLAGFERRLVDLELIEQGPQTRRRKVPERNQRLAEGETRLALVAHEPLEDLARE